VSKLTNLQRLIVLGAIGTDERRRAIQAQSNLRAWCMAWCRRKKIGC
jgi:hypothetical protein